MEFLETFEGYVPDDFLEDLEDELDYFTEDNDWFFWDRNKKIYDCKFSPYYMRLTISSIQDEMYHSLSKPSVADCDTTQFGKKILDGHSLTIVLHSIPLKENYVIVGRIRQIFKRFLQLYPGTFYRGHGKLRRL